MSFDLSHYGLKLVVWWQGELITGVVRLEGSESN